MLVIADEHTRHIIHTPRPYFTLGFTVSVVYSMGFSKYTIHIHRYVCVWMYRQVSTIIVSHRIISLS